MTLSFPPQPRSMHQLSCLRLKGRESFKIFARERRKARHEWLVNRHGLVIWNRAQIRKTRGLLLSQEVEREGVKNGKRSLKESPNDNFTPTCTSCTPQAELRCHVITSEKRRKHTTMSFPVTELGPAVGCQQLGWPPSDLCQPRGLGTYSAQKKHL